MKIHSRARKSESYSVEQHSRNKYARNGGCSVGGVHRTRVRGVSELGCSYEAERRSEIYVCIQPRSNCTRINSAGMHRAPGYVRDQTKCMPSERCRGILVEIHLLCDSLTLGYGVSRKRSCRTFRVLLAIYHLDTHAPLNETLIGEHCIFYLKLKRKRERGTTIGTEFNF